jgi:hypothetical protein
VLGDSTRFKTSLDPINQLILDRVVDLLLDGQETKSRKSFLILDEARELGKVRKLHAALNLGRSKGVSVTLGFQDIDGFRSVYGEKEASEMTGQINNKTFLRTDSHATAKWAEEHFGVVELRVETTSVTVGPDGKAQIGTTVSNRVQPLVLGSQVMGIPRTSPEHGFTGLHDVPSVGAFVTEIPFDEVIDQLEPSDPNEPNHEARADSDQLLKEWTPADLQRLKLPASLLITVEKTVQPEAPVVVSAPALPEVDPKPLPANQGSAALLKQVQRENR